MDYIKLTRPDGKPLYLWPDPPPARITDQVDSNGRAEITLQNGIIFRVYEYPLDVIKSLQMQRVRKEG